jgi:hypothetical protein
MTIDLATGLVRQRRVQLFCLTPALQKRNNGDFFTNKKTTMKIVSTCVGRSLLFDFLSVPSRSNCLQTTQSIWIEFSLIFLPPAVFQTNKCLIYLYERDISHFYAFFDILWNDLNCTLSAHFHMSPAGLATPASLLFFKKQFCLEWFSDWIQNSPKMSRMCSSRLSWSNLCPPEQPKVYDNVS